MNVEISEVVSSEAQILPGEGLKYEDHDQRLSPLIQELSCRIESLTAEVRKLTSTPYGPSPERISRLSGMYGYVEATAVDSLSESQKTRLDSGLREFLNGGVPLTEPVSFDSWCAFSDRFIKFLEKVGLHVQNNWDGFAYDDTTRAGVSAHKLQALHLYHGYALENPKSLRWYISSRTMETFRFLCLARGLL